MTATWLAPTFVYLFCLGAFGVTGKLALRSLEWPDIVLWTGIGYGLAAAVLVAIGRTEVRLVEGTGWAIASAVLAISGLITAYLALGHADASKVMSISAAYPIVTLGLSAVLLSEHISLARCIGVGLVVVGVVVLSIVR